MLVFRLDLTGGFSSSSPMRVPEEEDAVDMPRPAPVREVFNTFALDVLYDRGGGAWTVGTFLSLEPFVSSKQKYPNINAANAIDAPARQGKRYLTTRKS